MRISDWSSDVCSSDLQLVVQLVAAGERAQVGAHARQRLGEHLAAKGAVDRRELVEAKAPDQHAERGALHQQGEEREAGGMNGDEALDLRRNVGVLGDRQERKSAVEGKSVSVSVDIGGRRIIKQKKHTKKHN